MSALFDRLEYEIGKVLHRHLGRALREYEKTTAAPLTEKQLDNYVRDVEHRDAATVEGQTEHPANVIPLHVSDLDREISELNANSEHVQGLLLVKLYRDGDIDWTQFGHASNAQLALVGAVVTQEALLRGRQEREEEGDGA